jgi:hypothetical protein
MSSEIEPDIDAYGGKIKGSGLLAALDRQVARGLGRKAHSIQILPKLHLAADAHLPCRNHPEKAEFCSRSWN